MTVNVVDIGCATHGIDSIDYLIDQWHPTSFWGFDPWPDLEERDFVSDGTRVEIRRRAAWTHDGQIPYMVAGTGSHVGEGPMTVPCFDLAHWLDALDGPIVLKVDAEGAEYPLLEHLIATGVDAQIKLLLVEWHDGDHGLPDRLACPVEEWER